MKRTKTDRRLWHRLEGYSFHERPLTRSLVDRLEDETGHSTDVCYILVEEYRRFMYLVGSTGETLAPSPIVDVVWRLHVEDKKAYFDDFCPRIIGRTIHYAGADADAPHFLDDPAYTRTLDRYAQEFGRAQVQYWPDPIDPSVGMSSFLLWIIGLAAVGLGVMADSVLFAVFGALVILAQIFLRWKYAPLPLRT